MFCDAVRYMTFTFSKLYVLELLRCVQLQFVTLRHVMFTLCCFTLCSNIHSTANIQHPSEATGVGGAVAIYYIQWGRKVYAAAAEK